MIELTIKSVTSKDKKSDGTPLTGKFGAYWIIRADTEEEGYVTWFAKKACELKAGDKISGTLEVKTTEKDGKQYVNKNFSFPKQGGEVSADAFRLLSNRVTTLEMSEARRMEEFQKQFVQFKNDMTIDLLGTVNSSSELKRAEANTKQVMDNMGIVDDMPDSVYSNDAGEIDF